MNLHFYLKMQSFFGTLLVIYCLIAGNHQVQLPDGQTQNVEFSGRVERIINENNLPNQDQQNQQDQQRQQEQQGQQARQDQQAQQAQQGQQGQQGQHNQQNRNQPQIEGLIFRYSKHYFVSLSLPQCIVWCKNPKSIYCITF